MRYRNRCPASWGAAVCLVLLGGAAARAQFATDGNGLIVAEQWLALGPFQTPLGCDGVPGITGLFANHIGPAHHLGCEAPEEGDRIEDYDPEDLENPTLGLTEIAGVNADPDGTPIWWALDIGNPGSGALFLDGTVLGDQTEQVMFLATYIEYLGDEPIVVDFCHGTDDDGQVWIDDQLVQNQTDCSGLNDCEYAFKALITPGQHIIKMGVWEQGGGWEARLSMRVDGAPVVDGDPDWVFLGREGEVDLGDCEADRYLVYDRPERVGCEANEDGSRLLTWNNSVDTDPDGDIEILVNGELVATLPGGTTSHTVSAADAARGDFFCVRASSGLETCVSCSTELTDLSGNVLGPAWLIFGPLNRRLAGCPSNPNDLLRNTIAPSRIDCLYPEEGDEIDYDEADPASSTTGLVDLGFNVGPSGLPLVHRFDDGTPADTNMAFDAHFAPGQSNVVGWVITYIEYVGAAGTTIDICHGTDDDGQIWFNNTLVQNQPDCSGTPDCEYRVSGVSIEAGTIYRVAVGMWETGGGWDLKFRMEDSATGLPILDGDPDWVFHGRKKPAGFEAPECTGCELEPVRNLTCELEVTPLGFQRLRLTWENPDVTDLQVPTRILINGELVATVGSNDTSAFVAENQFPDGFFTVQVIHCGGVPAACSPFRTDDQGHIIGSAWLALGPIAGPCACAGSPECLLGSHIAPSHIACEYPEDGDEPEAGVDFDDPSNPATGFHPATDGRWRPFQDGTPTDGDLDMDQDIAGALDGHMTWVLTYVEYLGDPTSIQLCVGSDDDMQVWDNDQLVHNNAVCRGRGFCQDRVIIDDFQPGVHALKMAVWENGGGWGGSLAIQDELGTPIVDGNPDWIFHGISRPAGFEGPCDVGCLSPVQELVCDGAPGEDVEVSWVNPEGCDGPFTISYGGEVVGAAPAGATEFTIPAADVPFAAAVEVDNGSILPASCSLIQAGDYNTDLGFVSGWLHLGPLAQAGGAAPGCDAVRLDYLTDGDTSELEIEPSDGDEIEPDYGGLAASLGLNPAEACLDCNPGGIPMWRAFTALEGVTDLFDVNTFVSAGDNQMSYGMFYIDVARAMTVDIGVASDDAIQVLVGSVGDDLQEVWCNSVARGFGGANAVQDVIRDVDLPAGQVKVMVKVFEGGGGHGWRLRFQKNGQPILPGEISLEPGAVEPRTGFERGDADASGAINITDGIFILNFLFLGGPGPGCADAADVDDSGATNITDGIYVLNFLFLGGPTPPAPHGRCGQDPTADNLGCATPHTRGRCAQ